jgi:hypothetical protein
MSSSVVSSLHHLRIAKEYMDDFIRSAPNSRGAAKYGEYKRRIDWILTDIITYPFFRDEVREGLKKELESDVFTFASIIEKAALLNPEQRDGLEEVIESILKGETIEIKLHGTTGLSTEDCAGSQHDAQEVYDYLSCNGVEDWKDFDIHSHG